MKKRPVGGYGHHSFQICRKLFKQISPRNLRFPGGKIKDDEKASEAVLRELEEETGLKGEIMKKGESCIDSGELGYWRLYPFVVEVKENEVELNHEHSDYKWVEKQEVEKFDTLGELKALKILDSS